MTLAREQVELRRQIRRIRAAVEAGQLAPDPAQQQRLAKLLDTVEHGVAQNRRTRRRARKAGLR